jgi:hypothetical protein
MAIGANSYGSVDEVRAFTRHLLDGSAGFDQSTRPTLTEVEAFIARVSGVLNSAIASGGFDIPITQATAALACDDWVVTRAAAYVEMTQRGAGWSEQENPRINMLYRLHKDARQFVKDNAVGWKELGVSSSRDASQGFNFTALTPHSDRSDPDNTALEQPVFRRHLFDR